MSPFPVSLSPESRGCPALLRPQCFRNRRCLPHLRTYIIPADLPLHPTIPRTSIQLPPDVQSSLQLYLPQSIYSRTSSHLPLPYLPSSHGPRSNAPHHTKALHATRCPQHPVQATLQIRRWSIIQYALNIKTSSSTPGGD
jgi:hypothetical protein